MFLSLKFIHSILSSSPAPEGHYLSISELSASLPLVFDLSWTFIHSSRWCFGPSERLRISPHTQDLWGHTFEGLLHAQDVALLMEDGISVHYHLAVLCYLNNSWFHSAFLLLLLLSFFLFGKLGHRCFMAAKCFETFSYVQWEKKPLKFHAEIIKLFNFTVNLSAQVINLSLYCLLLHTGLLRPITFSRCLRVSF